MTHSGSFPCKDGLNRLLFIEIPAVERTAAAHLRPVRQRALHLVAGWFTIMDRL